MSQPFALLGGDTIIMEGEPIWNLHNILTTQS